MHSIRPATAADLQWCLHLQRTFSNQVGFIPSSGYTERIARGQVWLTEENDLHAAMLLGTFGRHGIARISQAACPLDLQRSMHGAALVIRFARLAAIAGAQLISCTVRDDIPAHAFWRALGFSPFNVRPGGKARGRLLTDYIASVDSVSIAAKALTAAAPPSMISMPSGG